MITVGQTTDYPVFKNAPITEALLDMKVILPSSSNIETLASVQEDIKEDYPEKQELHHWEMQAVAMGASKPEVTQSGGLIGYRFLPILPKQDKVVQARFDGFTFSKLKPYYNWHSFKTDAENLWNIYTRICKPIQVSRIGLRTINSLNFPLPFKDFKEYILTTPEVAPNIPSGLAHFFMQLSIPQPGGEMAIITSAMQPLIQPNTTHITVLFDIDVFVENTYSIDSKEIWEKIECLRLVRNEIFFNSLTDKAKELF